SVVLRLRHPEFGTEGVTHVAIAGYNLDAFRQGKIHPTGEPLLGAGFERTLFGRSVHKIHIEMAAAVALAMGRNQLVIPAGMNHPETTEVRRAANLQEQRQLFKPFNKLVPFMRIVGKLFQRLRYLAGIARDMGPEVIAAAARSGRDRKSVV